LRPARVAPTGWQPWPYCCLANAQVRLGAAEIMTPLNMPCSDRQSSVRDPHGNLWWLSQRLAPGPY
jgi:hypothetical protein